MPNSVDARWTPAIPLPRERQQLGVPSFTVLTPINSRTERLPHCIASVADQSGVTVQHLLVDYGCDPAVIDLLAQDARVMTMSNPALSLAEAILAAVERSTGDICLMLRSHEQLLPGVLESVGAFFAAKPEFYLAFAGALTLDPQGNLIDRRPPAGSRSRAPLLNRLPAFGRCIFIRRSAFRNCCDLFETLYRSIGDVAWILDALHERSGVGIMGGYATVQFDPTAGLDARGLTITEWEALHQRSDQWMRPVKVAIGMHRRLQRILNVRYRRRRIEYDIHTTGLTGRRVACAIAPAHLSASHDSITAVR